MQIFDSAEYWRMHFIKKFDREILMDSLLGHLYLSTESENLQIASLTSNPSIFLSSYCG